VGDATWYEPVPTRCFRDLLGALDIDFRQYTFIDFGSGKGRALFLAADYPFQEILGIEFSPQLHEIAVQNIANYRNSRQRCFQIESVCIDAVDYQLPAVPSVLFFYSPFKAVVFERVLANIRASLRSHPRSMFILYVGVLPELVALLQNSGLPCREVQLRTDYMRGERKRGLILQSASVNGIALA
jgi:SAM-dependent methyltransferase